MLKNFLSYLLCAAFTSMPVIAGEPIINFAGFDAYVEKSMTEWAVPGAAVAIVQNNQIIHLKTYGMRDLESKKPVSPDTIFYIVSLTKGFTAALMARLVDEGKIHWKDKVRKYLPEFKLADEKAATEFTIEDLLSQRSGLPGFATDSLAETGWTAEEIYQDLAKIPLKAELGSQYAYQNIFPGIAGWIATKVTGKPISDLYKEYLFAPLHLEHTTVGRGGLTGGESLWVRLRNKYLSPSREYSAQYFQRDGQAVAIPSGNQSIYCFESSRGINSTITDMAKWVIFQLNQGTIEEKALISAANFQAMHTPHVTVGAPQGGRLFPRERVKNIDYGMGWFLHDYDRLQISEHMGGMTGTRSLIAIVPAEKIGIVILTNLGGMKVSLFPEAIRSKFLDLYLKLPDQHDWSKELLEETRGLALQAEQARSLTRLQNPLPSRQEIAYVGTFVHSLYGTVKITSENNRLFLHYRNLKVELKHWNGDNFTFEANDFSSAYPANDRGEVNFHIGDSAQEDDFLKVSLLQEGADNLFYRKKETG